MALPVVTRCRCGEIVAIHHGDRVRLKSRGDSVVGASFASGHCRRCAAPFSVPMDCVQSTTTSLLTPIGKLAYDV